MASSLPTIEVRVPAFLVTRDKVTRGQFAALREWSDRFGMSGLMEPEGPGKLPTFTIGEEALTDEHPQSISWWSAAAYARWMHGSLPSESQWEYAARGGTTTRYPWGDDEEGILAYGWVAFNSGETPMSFESHLGKTAAERQALRDAAKLHIHPVGELRANAFGIRGMLGNGTEWCGDVCAVDGLEGYPTDGSPRTAPRTARRVRRGNRHAETGWFEPLVRWFEPVGDKGAADPLNDAEYSAETIRLVRPLAE